MRFAADLHLHSRFAGGVSAAMTLENIALWAQRKGVDLLATGDCLQADWLREIETKLIPAEPGFFLLRPDIESAIQEKLPPHLHRPLRFVLSTEVNCAPPGTRNLGGIHHLIYFPSIESVHAFREKVLPFGHLQEGRPDLALDSRALLDLVLQHGPHCHLAPAHVFNPWYSTLGTISGSRSVGAVFGDLAPCLLAVETGLTSTPPMCRRVPSLDSFALFSCSDAHSLENIGREYTLVEIEPRYTALFTALRKGSSQDIRGTCKFPLYRTRYFLNWCGQCQDKFDARICPKCRRPLVDGSRERLEKIVNRPTPLFPAESPPFQELLPLAHLIGELIVRRRESDAVKRLVQLLVEKIGHERYILTQAHENEIADIAAPSLARAILAQRRGEKDFSLSTSRERDASERKIEQTLLDLG
jgi:DNA helicase-2/ATP-dependent DNA helicase PcrA